MPTDDHRKHVETRHTPIMGVCVFLAAGMALRAGMAARSPPPASGRWVSVGRKCYPLPATHKRGRWVSVGQKFILHPASYKRVMVWRRCHRWFCFWVGVGVCWLICSPVTRHPRQARWGGGVVIDRGLCWCYALDINNKKISVPASAVRPTQALSNTAGQSCITSKELYMRPGQRNLPGVLLVWRPGKG